MSFRKFWDAHFHIDYMYLYPVSSFIDYISLYPVSSLIVSIRRCDIM